MCTVVLVIYFINIMVHLRLHKIVYHKTLEIFKRITGHWSVATNPAINTSSVYNIWSYINFLFKSLTPIISHLNPGPRDVSSFASRVPRYLVHFMKHWIMFLPISTANWDACTSAPHDIGRQPNSHEYWYFD